MYLEKKIKFNQHNDAIKLYTVNNCRVKPTLEKILLCRLFETDTQFSFMINCHF
jgi:hypothetical protein